MHSTKPPPHPKSKAAQPSLSPLFLQTSPHSPIPHFLHHSTPNSISLVSPPHPAHALPSFPSPSKSNNHPVTPSSRAGFFLEEFFFHDICVNHQGWVKNRFPLITSTAQSCSFVSSPVCTVPWLWFHVDLFPFHLWKNQEFCCPQEGG